MKGVAKEVEHEEKDKENNENMNEESQDLKVYLKARILKTATGFHKLVYNESTIHVNNLIEALVTRGKDAEAKKKNFQNQQQNQAAKQPEKMEVDTKPAAAIKIADEDVDMEIE